MNGVVADGVGIPPAVHHPVPRPPGSGELGSYQLSASAVQTAVADAAVGPGDGGDIAAVAAAGLKVSAVADVAVVGDAAHQLAYEDSGVSPHRALNRRILLPGASWTVNFDPERPETVGEPLVVAVAAAAAVGGERDGVADIDHCRETVDADTLDPAVAAEHGDQGDLVERGDQGDPAAAAAEGGDQGAVAGGVAVGAAAVGAAELSSL